MPLKIVTAVGYEPFWKMVKEMDAEASEKKLPLLVIVKSTIQPDGTCWCRDCAILDKMLESKLPSMNLDGIMLIGEAGTLEEWLDPANRFKKDTLLSLKSIPTAFRWKDGKPVKRMEGPEVFNAVKFKSLFA